MEIETDKTTVGVPSPSHGIIEEIFVADGDTVKSGQQLFRLKITSEAPQTKPAAAQAQPMKPSSEAPPPAPAPKPAVSKTTFFNSFYSTLTNFRQLHHHHQLLHQLRHRLLPNQQRQQPRYRSQPFATHSLSMRPL